MYRVRTVSVVAFTVLVSASGAGCGPLYLVSALLSPEWAAYQAALRDYEQRVARLPSVAVQVVNRTALAVDVTVVAGMEEPDPPVTISEMPPYFVPNTSPSIDIVPVDSQYVSAAAGATQSITVKCGEVIGVSVTTLGEAEDTPAVPVVGQFGLSVFAGNVPLGGLGTADDTGLARFIRPGTDDLDCTAQTLVLTVEATDGEAVTGKVTVAE